MEKTFTKFFTESWMDYLYWDVELENQFNILNIFIAFLSVLMIPSRTLYRPSLEAPSSSNVLMMKFIFSKFNNFIS